MRRRTNVLTALNRIFVCKTDTFGRMCFITDWLIVVECDDINRNGAQEMKLPFFVIGIDKIRNIIDLNTKNRNCQEH